MFNFDTFLETLKKNLSGVIQEFGEEYKEDILNDAVAFALKARKDLELWAAELKEGRLSIADVEFLIKSKKDLAEMEALKQKGLAQAKLDKLKADIINEVVGAVRKVG